MLTAVHARRHRTPVARDPDERHRQRRRVTHEIEQVIEPAAWISRRPTVQFGLHARYPLERARPGQLQRGAAIRRRIFRHYNPSCPNRCRPFPCDRPSRPRSTTATPPHPRSTVDGGRPRTVPVFTAVHSIEEEPDSAPAASPCLRRRPSARTPRSRASPTPESSPALLARGRAAPGPDPPGWSRYSVEEALHHQFLAYLDRLRRWYRELRSRDLLGTPTTTELAIALKLCEERFETYAHQVYVALSSPTG